MAEKLLEIIKLMGELENGGKLENDIDKVETLEQVIEYLKMSKLKGSESVKKYNNFVEYAENRFESLSGRVNTLENTNNRDINELATKMTDVMIKYVDETVERVMGKKFRELNNNGSNNNGSNNNTLTRQTN